MQQETPHLLQGYNGISISLNAIRNLLWHPKYYRWVDRGGFDYRTFIRKLVITSIGNFYDGEKRILNTSNIDIPSSMGKIHELIAECVTNFYKLFNQPDIMLTLPPTILDICDANVSRSIFCDLVVSWPSKLYALFIDPFPSDSLWSMNEYETAFLMRSAAMIEDVMKEMAPEAVELQQDLQAGILNLHSCKYNDANRELKLEDMIDAIKATLIGDKHLEEGSDQKMISELLKKEGIDG